MSNKITVVNKTGSTLWAGVDSSYIQDGKSHGWQGNFYLPPTQSQDFMVSGAGPYRVGVVTVISGILPYGEDNAGLQALMMYNIVPNCTITVAAEPRVERT
jgi:hypothetical protein